MARYCAARAGLREARALELKLKGHSWDTISSELGYYDGSGARKAAMRGLKKRTQRAATAYVVERLVELELLQRRLMQQGAVIDARVANQVLRASEERLGLLV